MAFDRRNVKNVGGTRIADDGFEAGDSSHAGSGSAHEGSDGDIARATQKGGAGILGIEADAPDAPASYLHYKADSRIVRGGSEADSESGDGGSDRATAACVGATADAPASYWHFVEDASLAHGSSEAGIASGDGGSDRATADAPADGSAHGPVVDAGESSAGARRSAEESVMSSAAGARVPSTLGPESTSCDAQTEGSSVSGSSKSRRPAGAGSAAKGLPSVSSKPGDGSCAGSGPASADGVGSAGAAEAEACAAMVDAKKDQPSEGKPSEGQPSEGKASEGKPSEASSSSGSQAHMAGVAGSSSNAESRRPAATGGPSAAKSKARGCGPAGTDASSDPAAAAEDTQVVQGSSRASAAARATVEQRVGAASAVASVAAEGVEHVGEFAPVVKDVAKLCPVVHVVAEGGEAYAASLKAERLRSLNGDLARQLRDCAANFRGNGKEETEKELLRIASILLQEPEELLASWRHVKKATDILLGKQHVEECKEVLLQCLGQLSVTILNAVKEEAAAQRDVDGKLEELRREVEELRREVEETRREVAALKESPGSTCSPKPSDEAAPADSGAAAATASVAAEPGQMSEACQLVDDLLHMVEDQAQKTDEEIQKRDKEACELVNDVVQRAERDAGDLERRLLLEQIAEQRMQIAEQHMLIATLFRSQASSWAPPPLPPPASPPTAEAQPPPKRPSRSQRVLGAARGAPRAAYDKASGLQSC